ncbi:MAG: hypothetical protein WCB68_09900 [Pyrinomonadaceae bacterium]
MIVSAHHFTGFWFESDLYKQPDVDQQSASKFLTAALNSLNESNRGDGWPKGAINTGIDPAHLSRRKPGHLWLKDRLQWMKQTFTDFDDEPGLVLKDIDQRREPFPAFHWTLRYPVGDRSLPLDGVQVLVGRDFVIIHEFSVLPESLNEISPDVLRWKRFAQLPEPSTILFTSAFSQISDFGESKLWGDLVEASRVFNHKVTELDFGSSSTIALGDWSKSDFAVGLCPEVKASLRFALSGDERRYRGCLLVNGSEGDEAICLDQNLSSQIQYHINASAYFTLFCTLLTNYSKVQYEYHVADRAYEELEPSLNIRFNDAEELRHAWNVPGQHSFSNTSINALSDAHLTDRTLLDRFNQLIDTCRRNTKQFERFASQLMESDNRWTANARRRISHENANLLVRKKELRRVFNTTKEIIDQLRRNTASMVAAAPATSPRAAADEKLLHLRSRLSEQLDHCNEFCRAFAEFQLFDPSKEALRELFEHEMPVPVTSKRDFRSFIILLHMVFDESVPSVIRRWKPDQQVTDSSARLCPSCRQPVSAGKPIQPLPEPLTRVAEVLHGDDFNQLSILRNNFAAHDSLHGDGVKATKKLSQVYENLVGDKTLARYDVSRWLELQKAVLEMLSEVLEEVLQIFEQHQGKIRKPRLT